MDLASQALANWSDIWKLNFPTHTHRHVNANKCHHLNSKSQWAPFWATQIGLVIHSKVAAVRRKVALPLRWGCVCLKWIWVFLPGWRKEGWWRCPAAALFRVALWAQQAAVSLNNPVLVWPDRHSTAPQWNHHAVSATSIGIRFHGDLWSNLSSQKPKFCYTPIQ